MKNNYTGYSNLQLTALVCLRVAIGWHFLYEGVSKLLTPGWSSMGYLLDSKGCLSDYFISLAANSNLLSIVDFLNVWGLIAIGIGLIVGLLTQVASVAGIILLLFYYLSHPSLISAKFSMPSEGAYLWINKNLIELIAITVLMLFPTGSRIGLDRLIFQKKDN